MMTITQDQIDRVGELVDKADNLLGATKLPLPPTTHLEGLTSGLTDIRGELREIYQEVAGENPWADHPDGS